MVNPLISKIDATSLDHDGIHGSAHFPAQEPVRLSSSSERTVNSARKDSETFNPPRSTPSTKERTLSTHLLDACDTLDLLAGTGSAGKTYGETLTPTEEQGYIHGRPAGASEFFKSSCTLNSLHPEWDRFIS